VLVLFLYACDVVGTMTELPTIISKVKVLQTQLGVPASGKSLAEDVKAIAFSIGIWDRICGKVLATQVDLCYNEAIGAPKSRVKKGAKVAPVVVGTVVKIVPEQPPVDLRLGTTPSHGNPQSTNALNTELNNVARNTDDTARARSLVAAGADLNSTNGPMWRHTPLHQAAYHGRYEMAKALQEMGADTTLHSNPCGRGKHGTPLELARGGGHHRIVALLEGTPAGQQKQTLKKLQKQKQKAAPVHPRFIGQNLWDRSQHPNGGPRSDQNLPCLSICCAAPFLLCPLDCMSAWGYASAVEAITSVGACKDLWCLPCSPNAKNPLWCCSEPLGWAASHGQLHTVMALVGNGADPRSLNAAGYNAVTDAEREKHAHVVEWLRAWERAGKPPKAPSNGLMKRG